LTILVSVGGLCWQTAIAKTLNGCGLVIVNDEAFELNFPSQYEVASGIIDIIPVPNSLEGTCSGIESSSGEPVRVV
jgi:hypothetical protein